MRGVAASDAEILKFESSEHNSVGNKREREEGRRRMRA